VGHSLGATGVSIVQGYDPWPGKLDAANPVDAVVAWDNLADNSTSFAFPERPDITPRVPAMGLSGDYFIIPTPYTSPPNPNGKIPAFTTWLEAGVPSYEVVIQAGTHQEFSRIPHGPGVTPPSTSWVTWGNLLTTHYSLAWIDRWLKQPGEGSFDTADARLLADADWVCRMSFYYRSARSFPTRQGAAQGSHDIRGQVPPAVVAACGAAGGGAGATVPTARPAAAVTSQPRFTG
jgi:hypothetical protein